MRLARWARKNKIGEPTATARKNAYPRIVGTETPSEYPEPETELNSIPIIATSTHMKMSAPTARIGATMTQYTTVLAPARRPEVLCARAHSRTPRVSTGSVSGVGSKTTGAVVLIG